MLNWANQFNICCLLDNHHYNLSHHKYECVVAAGAKRFVEANAGNALTRLQAFIHQENDWMFGHLSYDLKNEIEQLHSAGHDGIKFPDMFFFVPEIVLQLDENSLSIGSFENDHAAIYNKITKCVSKDRNQGFEPVEVQSRFSKQEYIDRVQQLQRRILRGDCYEINFCQEFFATNTTIDPIAGFHSLGDASPNPYSAYYKLNDKYLLCASPERYLKKTGSTIISQPIKGTWRRTSTEEDEVNRNLLSMSDKDRSENVMVVDLVRNDLSKVCVEGSVSVDELFGVYTFPQLFQMISTVSGILKPAMTFTEIIKATFPMGSMTGAPKKKVMELIEEYEATRRGIFSGTVGYISPDKDFDLNVVIRSIMYNATERYLSFQAGSGITFYSDAEAEYQECLLKATAIKKVLAGSQYLNK